MNHSTVRALSKKNKSHTLQSSSEGIKHRYVYVYLHLHVLVNRIFLLERHDGALTKTCRALESYSLQRVSPFYRRIEKLKVELERRRRRKDQRGGYDIVETMQLSLRSFPVQMFTFSWFPLHLAQYIYICTLSSPQSAPSFIFTRKARLILLIFGKFAAS